MIPVVLSLKNKNILIVGGGKVALRKTKLFLKEDANITVVAPEFLEEFKTLDVKCIEKKYHPRQLNNMFLVYAATNHQEVNNKIVEDCNRRNILCGNAYNYEEVSFHSMSYQENELGIIGFSTQGKLPYNKPIVNKLMKVLEINSEKIKLLEDLRPYIISTKYNSRSYYEKLYNCPTHVLRFLYYSNIEKEGHLFIGKSYIKNMNFINNYSIALTYKEYMKYKELFIFNVDYKIFPMYLKESKHYKDVTKNIKHYGPILRDENDLKDVLKLIDYDKKTVLVSYPEVEKAFPDFNIYSSYDKLDLKNKNKVILLFISKGELYDEIMNKITKKEYNLEIIEIMNEPKFIEYLEKRLKK